MKHISSPHNSLIRKIQQLQRKSRARKNEGIFIIEGKRELGIAAQEGFEIETIFICPEIFGSCTEFSEDYIVKLFNLNQLTEIITVSIEVYDKVAYRGGTEGCIAFAKAETHNLDSLKLNSSPLILIAEAPEKPGNLGALGFAQQFPLDFSDPAQEFSGNNGSSASIVTDPAGCQADGCSGLEMCFMVQK